MSSLIGEFDKHRNIEYRNISKLFWSEYPFKVLVVDDIKQPEIKEWGWGQRQDEDNFNAWKAHRQLRTKFFYDRKRHCPEDGSLWRSQNNGGHTFSFFFKHTEDALHFVKKNRLHITTVYRPETDEQITALRSDRKLVLRDILFYGRYRYCVEFKEQFTLDEETRLDDMISGIFHKKNTKRYLYTFSKRRRLYLKNESDIFHVKLALYEKIRTQTEALLKKDI